MATQMSNIAATRDAALASHLSQVFNYMAGGVGVSAIVAWLVSVNPTMMQIAVQGKIVWLIALIGMSFMLNTIVFRLQPAAGLAIFAGFSALMGLTFAPFTLQFTNSSIATAFATASIMFAGTAAFGYFTKRSLSGWGTFLTMGVFGLFGASIIGLVLSLFGVNMGPLSFVISLVAVPLFAAMTAYDVNNIRETFAQYSRDDLMRSRLAILQATSLYMNFIQMFLSLLHIFGDRR